MLQEIASTSDERRPGRPRLNLSEEQRRERKLEQARRGYKAWRKREQAKNARRVVVIEILQARLRAAGLSDGVTDADIAALAMVDG